MKPFQRPRPVLLAVAGVLVALAFGSVAPALADPPPTLTLTVSPSPISTVDLTQPHALSITVRCATAIGTLTVTMTEPDGAVGILQPGVPVPGTSKGFDVSVTPAAHGDYVFAATSTGCGAAPAATVTATGPDIVTDVVTAPGQLSATAFAATGVTFTGTGFHAGVSLDVTSTVPGFAPTTVTTDAGGAFGFVQTGAPTTPDGYYSTSFTGQQDGVSLGTYLVGVAPPTVSAPHLTLSAHSVTLSQYLSTGVTATATGYVTGDLVLAQESPTSGVDYFLGDGLPDSSGVFAVTITGTADAAADRLGMHTVTFSSFLGPDVSDSFDVVADPVPSVVVSPDPVEQGGPIRFAMADLLPSRAYILLPDHGLGGGGVLSFTTDGSGSATVVDSVPIDYDLGPHSATLLVLGSGPAPVVVPFTVVAATVPTAAPSASPSAPPTGLAAQPDVTPSAGPDPTALAQTGSDVGPWIGIAGALLILGSVGVFAGMRRTRRAPRRSS